MWLNLQEMKKICTLYLEWLTFRIWLERNYIEFGKLFRWSFNLDQNNERNFYYFNIFIHEIFKIHVLMDQNNLKK